MSACSEATVSLLPDCQTLIGGSSSCNTALSGGPCGTLDSFSSLTLPLRHSRSQPSCLLDTFPTLPCGWSGWVFSQVSLRTECCGLWRAVGRGPGYGSEALVPTWEWERCSCWETGTVSEQCALRTRPKENAKACPHKHSHVDVHSLLVHDS